jgi:hypothetical protein
MSAPKETVDLEAAGVVSAKCEYCGGQYWIIPAGSEHDEGRVAHSLPMCVEFEVMETLDYVIANREVKKRKRAQA